MEKYPKPMKTIENRGELENGDNRGKPWKTILVKNKNYICFLQRSSKSNNRVKEAAKHRESFPISYFEVISMPNCF